MIDLNDPYTLNLLLMGALIIITILILYIFILRRRIKDLALVCSTDFALHRVLRITDDLLGKLPNSEVESFVTSPDFEIYKEALKPVIMGHKHVPEKPKEEPKAPEPKKTEVTEPEAKKTEIKKTEPVKSEPNKKAVPVKKPETKKPEPPKKIAVKKPEPKKRK